VAEISTKSGINQWSKQVSKQLCVSEYHKNTPQEGAVSLDSYGLYLTVLVAQMSTYRSERQEEMDV